MKLTTHVIAQDLGRLGGEGLSGAGCRRSARGGPAITPNATTRTCRCGSKFAAWRPQAIAKESDQQQCYACDEMAYKFSNDSKTVHTPPDKPFSWIAPPGRGADHVGRRSIAGATRFRPTPRRDRRDCDSLRRHRAVVRLRRDVRRISGQAKGCRSCPTASSSSDGSTASSNRSGRGRTACRANGVTIGRCAVLTRRITAGRRALLRPCHRCITRSYFSSVNARCPRRSDRRITLRPYSVVHSITTTSGAAGDGVRSSMATARARVPART